MGKDGFLTPKAIANRIKAKGLQKLRWYCQMCNKQCRDENGFKCHCESEGHLRQMMIFAANPHKFMDSYSQEFKDGFLELLKRRWPRTRVHANYVYNEYISDRHHTHMNSTMWSSLTQFVQYLGREGICTVEDTPKGWFITYNNKDPLVLEQQRRQEKKEKAELNDEERQQKLLEKQMKEAAKKEATAPTFAPPGPLAPVVPLETTPDGEKKIVFTLAPVKKETAKISLPLILKEDESEDKGKTSDSTSTTTTTTTGSSTSAPDSSTLPKAAEKRSQIEFDLKPDKKRKLSALEEIRLKQEADKQRVMARTAVATSSSTSSSSEPDDAWVSVGLVVKVLNRKVAQGKYYGKKGVVKEVIQDYIAMVELYDSGDLLKLDQEDLETVLPVPGGTVRVVGGRRKGELAKLVEVHVNDFNASVRFERDDTIARLNYEHICKISN